jgi:1-phosphofructokinase
MIVTLTANPALDRTVVLTEPLRVGEVQSAAGIREDAGGKGLNVSRVIAAAGHDTLAVLPLDAADPYAAVVRETGVAVHAVPVRGAARANIALTDSAGVTTKVNFAGAHRTAADAEALVTATVAAVEGAAWLVLAGSLPPGLPIDFYATVIRAVRERWGTAAPAVAVDTSGEALRVVVERGRPDLIKPNDLELAELAGIEARATEGHLTAAPSADLAAAVLPVARSLVPERVGAALVTLGGAGAVLVTTDGAWHATAPPTTVRSTVGAGDSSLAGYLLAASTGLAPAEALRAAVRHGSAAAALPGTQLPTPADLPRSGVPVRGLPA